MTGSPAASVSSTVLVETTVDPRRRTTLIFQACEVLKVATPTHGEAVPFKTPVPELSLHAQNKAQTASAVSTIGRRERVSTTEWPVRRLVTLVHQFLHTPISAYAHYGASGLLRFDFPWRRGSSLENVFESRGPVLQVQLHSVGGEADGVVPTTQHEQVQNLDFVQLLTQALPQFVIDAGSVVQ